MRVYSRKKRTHSVDQMAAELKPIAAELVALLRELVVFRTTPTEGEVQNPGYHTDMGKKCIGRGPYGIKWRAKAEKLGLYDNMG